MRLGYALITDYKFQLKQGFYIIYGLLTVMYMVVLSLLPDTYKQMVLPLLIYSDPAFVGLFFIGGIIMLERLQGVLSYLVVTPLKIREYMLSKLITLTTLAVVASLAITWSADYGGTVNELLMILGVVGSSIFFVLIGVVVSTYCETVNQYIVKMIPAILIFVLPCASLLGTGYHYVWTVFPSVAGLRVLLGAFYPAELLEMICLLGYIILWDVLLFNKVVKIFQDRIIYGGE